MNIALPILLLVFGGLTLWVLTESSVKWYLKASFISVFCIFTVIFWSSIHSFLGWAANENDMPEKMLIHWVIIKEPNKFTKFDGVIYILSESVEKQEYSFVEDFFGYNKKKIEPRLYGLKYNRNLHEQLEKSVIPSLRKGQPVVGKLKKEKAMGKDGKKQEGEEGKGDGSESQKQEWHFHKLLPSEIHSKPER